MNWRDETTYIMRTKLAALILFGLFVICLLLVLVAGVKAYSTMMADEGATKAGRFAGGLLENSVRACDEVDSVAKAQGPQGLALVLIQTTNAGVFETRFYLYNGQLMQEYTPKGAPFAPLNAVSVMRSKKFEFSYMNNLLKIETDEGETDIALRSGRDGRTDSKKEATS